jgi:hypothetical protein
MLTFLRVVAYMVLAAPLGLPVRNCAEWAVSLEPPSFRAPLMQKRYIFLHEVDRPWRCRNSEAHARCREKGIRGREVFCHLPPKPFPYFYVRLSPYDSKPSIPHPTSSSITAAQRATGSAVQCSLPRGGNQDLTPNPPLSPSSSKPSTSCVSSSAGES